MGGKYFPFTVFLFFVIISATSASIYERIRDMVSGSTADMIAAFIILGFGLDLVVGFAALICGKTLNLEWSIGSLFALIMGSMGMAVYDSAVGNEVSLSAMMASFGIIFTAWAMGAIVIKIFSADV